jgi:putative transposase
VKDEATSFCLAIDPGKHLDHSDVHRLLKQLIVRYGRPRWIRSDNGGELIASALQEAIKRDGLQPVRIDPGKPWQNGSNESFNGTLRRECLDAEIFTTFDEARIVIAAWRRKYNSKRPHSSIGYITPEMAYFGKRKP